MTKEERNTLEGLIKSGDQASALGFLEIINKKEDEPKSEIQKALEIQKAHQEKLNQIKN